MASLKERMKKRKAELEQRASGKGSGMIFLKEGTLRFRILPVPEDADFIFDVDYFYLGKDLGGFVSPSTFGLDCAVREVYDFLKDSDDADNKDLAKKIVPKKKGLIYGFGYSDDKGKKIDADKEGKFVLLANSLQQDIIDLYLEDDWGEPFDPSTGYDIKLKRVGTGQKDTEYSALPCKNTPVPSKYKKTVINLEEEVKKLLPTYEQTLEKVEKYFGMTYDEIMEGSSPKVDEKSTRKVKKKVSTTRKKEKKS